MLCLPPGGVLFNFAKIHSAHTILSSWKFYPPTIPYLQYCILNNMMLLFSYNFSFGDGTLWQCCFGLVQISEQLVIIHVFECLLGNTWNSQAKIGDHQKLTSENWSCSTEEGLVIMNTGRVTGYCGHSRILYVMIKDVNFNVFLICNFLRLCTKA